MSDQISAKSSPQISKWMVLLITSMSSFITPFTSSSVNIALPSLGSELHLHAVTLSWVATTYLLAAAVFLVPFGRIADIYGRKHIFLIGISIDAIASVIAGSAHSGTWLIAFRGMQGLGGAMIFGTGVAILTSVFPVKERGRALGINVAAVYFGLSIGPLIGGLLTEHLGWRSIFFLNAAIGLTIIGFVLTHLKGEWAGARGETFDYVGALIYSAGVVSLMLGLSLLPGVAGTALAICGAAGILVFVAWENRQKHPLLNIALFRKNILFRYSNLAALINYSGTFSVIFLLSLYLQYIDGLSPERAGLILIAQPVVMTLFSPLAGHLSDRIEPRIIASIGMALTTIGLALFAFLGSTTPLVFILLSLILIGLGFGFFSSPNTNAVMSSVERRHYAVASGTLGTMRLTGQMFSMVLSLMLFSLFIGPVQITPQYYPLFLKSVRTAFIISAALCFVGIFVSIARGRIRADNQIHE
jgi:EmrB/QacA subfamily drug resistance transporter